jgi:hypothetical protein
MQSESISWSAMAAAIGLVCTLSACNSSSAMKDASPASAKLDSANAAVDSFTQGTWFGVTPTITIARFQMGFLPVDAITEAGNARPVHVLLTLIGMARVMMRISTA